MSGHVCIRVSGGDAETLERAIAEAFSAGAAGLEELPGPPAALRVYAAVEAAAAVGAALRALAPPLRVGEAEPVAPVDWSQAWRQGLEAVRISARLAVRPSFLAPQGDAGAELVIDPGQAFGTGGHGSTRRALEWIDALPPAALARGPVLDVGCGTGVLGLAALRLGAERGVACDLDPLAVAAARENAAGNGLGERLQVFAGSADAVAPGRFALVVANLIRRELLPILPALARALAPDGCLILSGLLEAEREAVGEALAREGLAVAGARAETDALGDTWLGLLARRG